MPLSIFPPLLWCRLWCAAALTWCSSWETSSPHWEWFTRSTWTTRTRPRPYKKDNHSKKNLFLECANLPSALILFLGLFIDGMIVVLLDHLNVLLLLSISFGFLCQWAICFTRSCWSVNKIHRKDVSAGLSVLIVHLREVNVTEYGNN